jgi:hypothetical protein
MKFEEAIAEMRKGKRCKRNGDNAEYYVNTSCRQLVKQYEGSKFSSTSECAITLMLDDWSVVEPPLPLPRRFRAKMDGLPVAGVEFTGRGHSGSLNFMVNDSHSIGWKSRDRFTDLEYIDPPCTS